MSTLKPSSLVLPALILINFHATIHLISFRTSTKGRVTVLEGVWRPDLLLSRWSHRRHETPITSAMYRRKTMAVAESTSLLLQLVWDTPCRTIVPKKTLSIYLSKMIAVHLAIPWRNLATPIALKATRMSTIVGGHEVSRKTSIVDVVSCTKVTSTCTAESSLEVSIVTSPVEASSARRSTGLHQPSTNHSRVRALAAWREG